MDLLNKTIALVNWKPILTTSLRIVLILVIAWIAMIMLRKVLGRLERRLIKKSVDNAEPPTESAKRAETLVRLIRQALQIALWLTIVLIILRELALDIAPLLASAGVVGLAIGFGAQNLVRDFISGFFFILENQIRVGDVAVINGTGGLVEQINFRTIVLRDLSGVVHTFPNGTVSTLANLTRDWSAYVFDIGVAYKENTDRVIAIMKQVGAELLADPEYGAAMLEEPEIFGVDRFADSAVIIKGRIKTKPIRQWAVGREYLRRIKAAFDREDIEIPFPHATVYFGEKQVSPLMQLLDKNAPPFQDKE